MPTGRHTRRSPAALAPLALLGPLAALALLAACAADGQPLANPQPMATSQVTRTTLVETRTEPGTLGYGDSLPISVTGTGTITYLAPVGSVVSRGGTLFRVDEVPVVALQGTVPSYRTLELFEQDPLRGADVRQLQENLSALGFGGFEVDGVYSPATAEAVRAWQAHRGVAVTGVVDRAHVVFVPGPVRVAEHRTHLGDAVRGAPVLAVTGTERSVTVALRVGDLALAEVGGSVPVRLPGGGVVTGTIASLGTAVRNGTVDVLVTIDDQGALGTLTAASVEVDFVSRAREGVLAVPVAALLALAEGGYGVELVEGAATRVVPVETGMFARGRVEISGHGIAEGVRVGVPR